MLNIETSSTCTTNQAQGPKTITIPDTSTTAKATKGSSKNETSKENLPRKVLTEGKPNRQRGKRKAEESTSLEPGSKRWVFDIQ